MPTLVRISAAMFLIIGLGTIAATQGTKARGKHDGDQAANNRLGAAP
jgi:hypothetical protein